MDQAIAFSGGSESGLLLILAVLGGDASPEERDVLRERLWEHHRYLLALLRYRTGDEELAEDILQESYAAFLRRGDRPALRGDRGLRNYLVSIALNKLRDHFRGKDSPARRKEFRSEEEADAWVEGLASAEEGVEDAMAREEEEAERRRLVALSMEGLSEAHRAVLGLKYAENLGNEEIAARLGLGLKAAESLLFRAKASFRKEFLEISLRANEKASGRVHSMKEGRDGS